MRLAVRNAPNLDGFDLKSIGITLPGLLPGTSCVPELVYGMRRGVGPGLASHTIWEIVGSTTDGEINDEEELSVKWCRVVLSLPRVVEGGGELASVPEALLGEVNLENLVAVSIEVGVETLLVPVESVGVESVVKRLSVLVVLVS